MPSDPDAFDLPSKPALDAAIAKLMRPDPRDQPIQALARHGLDALHAYCDAANDDAIARFPLEALPYTQVELVAAVKAMLWSLMVAQSLGQLETDG